MTRKSKLVLVCFVAVGFATPAYVASVASAPNGPPAVKCRAKCSVFEVRPGNVSYGIYGEAVNLLLEEGSTCGGSLEQRGGRNPRKDEISVTVHGDKFPVKIDVSYTRTIDGKPAIHIGKNDVMIVDEKRKTLIASEDGKHVMLVIFHVIPEEGK